MILIVGIEAGKFCLTQDQGKVLRCPLTAQALAALFRRTGFDPLLPNNLVMGSSSLDFPDEDGAPRGFQAHKVLQEALSLLLKCVHSWQGTSYGRAPNTAGNSGRGRTVAMRRCCLRCGRRERKVYADVPGGKRKGRWRRDDP
jgi:hypothetical protein